MIRSNNNWKDDRNARRLRQQGWRQVTTKKPPWSKRWHLGVYTAIVRGDNRTIGVGLVEVYNIP